MRACVAGGNRGQRTAFSPATTVKQSNARRGQTDAGGPYFANDECLQRDDAGHVQCQALGRPDVPVSTPPPGLPSLVIKLARSRELPSERSATFATHGVDIGFRRTPPMVVEVAATCRASTQWIWKAASPASRCHAATAREWG